jgi:predicted HTH transcriptional regulator
LKIANLSDLKSLLKQKAVKEHTYENVELKRDWRRSHGEKLSMLCNGQPETDCFLVIGVEDNGNMAGHNEAWLRDQMPNIGQHCNTYLDPAISLVDLTSDDIEGNMIVIAHVKNPGVVVKWEGSAHAGKGTTKKKLSDQEILELNLSLPGLTDLTRQKTTYDPVEDLAKIFFEMAGISYEVNSLERYSLHNTRAGSILLGNLRFRVVRYDDNSDVLANDAREGILQLLTEVMFDEIKEYYEQLGIEKSRISSAMLREALGNAVGHAAYKDNDGEIILELHPSRLVISNLSFTEYTSLANKWFSMAHKSPNSYLMEILRIAKRVDELGRGKTKLLSECLRSGFGPPEINVSDAGLYKRWSLHLEINQGDDRLRLLFDQISRLYFPNNDKILIAYALVLWRQKPFSEIKRYFDAVESRIAAEIISDIKGPLFFWEEKDLLSPHRWVQILLEDGRQSRGFTPYEEKRIFNLCKEICLNHYSGYLTTSQFRELAHLSTSPSDKNLATRTLKKWQRTGQLAMISKGKYRFAESETVEIQKSTLTRILELFEKDRQE